MLTKRELQKKTFWFFNKRYNKERLFSLIILNEPFGRPPMYLLANTVKL